ERHAGLAGHGARQQRLAGAGLADQQYALGDLGADAQVLLRVLQEVDDLDELLLRLLVAGDVVEGRRDLVLAPERLGARLAELHHLVRPALGAHEDEPEEPDEDGDGQDRAHQYADPLRRVPDHDLWHAGAEVLQERVGEDDRGAERAYRLRLTADRDLRLRRQLPGDVAGVPVDD